MVLGAIVRASLLLGVALSDPGLRGGGATAEVGAVQSENLGGSSQGTTVAGTVGEVHAETLSEVADTFPDMSTGEDFPGPYVEEPSEAEAESPRPAIEGWENSTSLQASSFNHWGTDFCTSHRTGYFCDGYTRVRCCRQIWGFVKCGTTVHCSNCGWRAGQPAGWSRSSWGVQLTGYSAGSWGWGGGSWHIHPGWHQSSFCQSHHVGFFCYQRHKVHCCNDYGHFVDCTTRTESSWRC